MNNIQVVKLGLIAVSRDCFPIQLSEKRRAAIKETYKGELYECPVTVENEKDMEKALEDVTKQSVMRWLFSLETSDLKLLKL